MTKTELMHELIEYRDSKDKSPGLANIIQVVIDILLDDIAAESKYVKTRLEKGGSENEET